MIITGMLLYMTLLGMTFVLLFIDSRFSKKKTILIVYSTTMILMGVVIAAVHLLGQDAAVRLYTLIIHLPAFVLFSYLSRNRDWRLIFQFLSSILFCLAIQNGTALVYYLSGQQAWAWFLVYTLLSAFVLWFVSCHLRTLLSHVQRELKQGWWLICTVMAAYYVISIYLVPGYAGFERSSTIYKTILSFLMIGFYVVLIYFFSILRLEIEKRHNAQLSALQLSALQKRIDITRDSENAIRLERHDLRHRFQIIAELVKNGSYQQVLDFIDSSMQRLDETVIDHWCRPLVLDAVFSYHFHQAKQNEIAIDANISLPEALPIDEGELAVVFSNILENAIHANLALPLEKRKLRCKVICRPGLMFEISNPYTGKIQFDNNGFPIASTNGHGFGTRSISAFCQKYNALCQYELKDGWFFIRIII